MKTKFITLFILMSFAFIGCKNEKSVDSLEVIKPESIDTTFKVTLEVLAKKDDNFQVYYTEASSEIFTEEKSVWVAVKGMETSQKVVLSLPKDVVPALVRLDFGLNKEQGDIVLSEVDLDYLGNKFVAKGAVIGNYFRPLDPTKLDISTGIITATDKNGNRVEPVLYPHEIPLGEEILKLIK